MNDDRVYEAFYGIGVDPDTERITRSRLLWIVEHVPSGDVVDIGCSQGVASALLAARGERVVGVDVEWPAIAFAQARRAELPVETRQRVAFAQGDGSCLPFPDERFDHAVVTEVLEHVPDPASILQEVFRVLRPGGALVCTVPFGILPHDDHRRVFYRDSLRALLSPLFVETECTILDRHIGFVGTRRGEPAPVAYKLSQDEMGFFHQEQTYLKRIGSLQRRLDEANEAYRRVTATLASVQLDLSETKVALAEAKGEGIVGSLQAALRDRISQVEAITAKEREGASAIARLEREVEQLRTKLTKEQGQRRRLESRLEKIETSRAWRLIDAYRRTRRAWGKGRRKEKDDQTAATAKKMPAAPAARSAPVRQSLDAAFDSWVARATQAPGDEVVFMYSGTTYMQEKRANRPIRLTRVYLSHGRPVFFNYYRWRSDEPLPENEDELLFQSPVDITPTLVERLLDEEFGGKRRIMFASFPEELMVRVLTRATQKGWSTIYDVRDDWEEFAKVGMAKWYDPGFEAYIARNADIVTAVSRPLARKISTMAGGRDVEVVPNALDPAFPVAGARQPTSPPVVGYFGHLTEKWFDWPTIIAAAERYPEWQFELAGHQAPELHLPDNVALLGLCSHAELAHITRRWSLAVIPFKFGPLAEAVDPIKIYEYLHLGLPVLASYMPQVWDYPGVHIADSPEAFISLLPELVEDELDMDEVRSWLTVNTWEERVARYSRLVRDHSKGEHDPLRRILVPQRDQL